MESCARVERSASPLAAVCLAFASSSSASRARSAALFSFASSLSSSLRERERSRLDFLLLDLGGGDLDRDNERDEVLAVEGERLEGRLRLSAAPAAPASGEGDLESAERLSGERSLDGMLGDNVGADAGYR